MSNEPQSPRNEPEKLKISVLVLSRGNGWAAEVAIRSHGRLKTYRRDEQTLYATQDDARRAGQQWAEDYLRAEAATSALPTSDGV